MIHLEITTRHDSTYLCWRCWKHISDYFARMSHNQGGVYYCTRCANVAAVESLVSGFGVTLDGVPFELPIGSDTKFDAKFWKSRYQTLEAGLGYKVAQNGVNLIASERLAQGSRSLNDYQYKNGELIKAAIYYLSGIAYAGTPDWVSLEGKSNIRRLMIAGALVAAEIDRLLREG